MSYWEPAGDRRRPETAGSRIQAALLLGLSGLLGAGGVAALAWQTFRIFVG